MKDISENARQVREDLLDRGFFSPETAASEAEAIGPLVLKNSRNYRAYAELKDANLVLEVPSTSIHEPDRYYAVPPDGWQKPKPNLPNQNIDRDDLHTEAHLPAVNWSKWGALAAIAAIPVSILIWWLS